MTRNAYLLFYRRRTPTPLGPPSLQKIVQTAENDHTPDSDADNDDDETNRSRPRDHTDSGNGQRLDASSRNGSSSASTAGTGVVAGAAVLRAGGSHQLSARGSRLKNAHGAGSLSDDEGLLPYANDGANDQDDDEGFVDAEDQVDYVQDMYEPLNRYDDPVWSFGGLGTSSFNNQQSDDDVASDAPNLGSDGGEELGNRLLEDFGDDILPAGVSTPVEGIQPSLGGEFGDSDVHEIRVAGE